MTIKKLPQVVCFVLPQIYKCQSFRVLFIQKAMPEMLTETGDYINCYLFVAGEMSVQLTGNVASNGMYPHSQAQSIN